MLPDGTRDSQLLGPSQVAQTKWSQGGKTIAVNCNLLCRECNRRKSDK